MPLHFITTVLLMLLHLSLAAQETKRYTRGFTRSSQVSQSYYALKSNKHVMHGDYVRYFRVPTKHYKTIRNIPDSLEHYVWQRGVYANGKKHGEWIEFSSPGKLYSKGAYDQGKQTGVWTTNRENGEVLERFDHTTRQKLLPEIRISVAYPPKARTAGIQGEVLIQYRLQADCSISDLQVIHSLSAECDQEATRKLQKYFRYLKTYGPAQACEVKTDTFKVRFTLE